MTIESIPLNDRRERFSATGGQTVFTYDFPVYAETDIRVLRLRGAIEAVLLYGTDYAVTGAGEQGGGTIVLTAGAQAGDIITIESAMPAQRSAQFENGGALPADALEGEFNRFLILFQQLLAIENLAVRGAATDLAGIVLPAAPLRASRLLGFDSGGAPVALPPTDMSGTTVLAAGSTTVRSLAERFGNIADVKDYGALGNGAANDTAAFTAAFATGKHVYAPPGTYILTAGFTFNSNGQVFSGAGQEETILVPSGNFNLFTAPAPRDSVRAERFTVNAAGMTGGYLFNATGADRVEFRHIRVEDPFNVAYVYGCNAYTAEDIYVQDPRGPYGWHLFGDNTVRSDVVRLRDINIGLAVLTPGFTGIYWDGFVNTVQAYGVTIVNAGRGVHVVNSGGGPLPLFGIFYDLEVDFCHYEAVKLDAGEGFWFNFLYAQGSATTELVNIGAAVNSVRIDQGYIRGAFKEGLVVAGKDVGVTNTQVIFNSFPNYFTYDAVRIAGTARRVTIADSNLGQVEGIGATVRYGALVEAGALSVRFIGCDFSGTLAQDVLDQSGSTVPGNVEIVGSHASALNVNEKFAGWEFGCADGAGAQLTPTISAGQITAVAVGAGGSEYTVAPTIAAFDPTGAGSGFTATATISAAGAVTGVTVNTVGAGYAASTRVVALSAARNPTLKARFPGNANAAARLEADGTGVVQIGNDQGIGAVVSAPASSVNAVNLAGSAAGVPVSVYPTGADANVDLQLLPKGSGQLHLGGPIAGSAGAVVGYLTVKIGGTSYKVPYHAL
jgi:Pectate lyase superfamily protein